MRARTTIARLTLLLPHASSLLPFFCPPYQPHILQRRCTSPRLDSRDDRSIESLLRTVSREDLELVLTELESMRRYVVIQSCDGIAVYYTALYSCKHSAIRCSLHTLPQGCRRPEVGKRRGLHAESWSFRVTLKVGPRREESPERVADHKLVVAGCHHFCNAIGIALDVMDALTAGEEEVEGCQA